MASKNVSGIESSTPQKRAGDHLINEDVPSVKKVNKRCKVSEERTNFENEDDDEQPSFSTPDKKNSLHATEKLNNLAEVDMGESWKDALKKEFEEDYFKELMTFICYERENKTIYPSENEVFSWTKFNHIRDTKVVILGQDPYHGSLQAHGLSFSVKIGVPIPPSLKNIYKELENDIPGFVKPQHGHLIGWALQGVLLLNACLTVVANKANSHKGKGWEKFTDAVIRWLNLNVDDIVFILWGSYAEKKGQCLDESRHLVLAGKHPSPLSAYKGFIGCKHFSKANEYLKEKGKKEIDWKYLPESV